MASVESAVHADEVPALDLKGFSTPITAFAVRSVVATK
jgi:hypothetical protein